MTDASGIDRTDFNLGKVLTMTLPLLVVLTATHLEDANLIVPAMSQDGSYYGCARYQGSPDLQISAASDSQHLVDRDLLANIRSNLFYFDLFAGGNFVLLAAGFYDRVHISPFNAAAQRSFLNPNHRVRLSQTQWTLQNAQSPRV